jgi:glutamine synthetase type III
MPVTLSEIAREKGLRYFLISFTDLFGVQRSKLVPAAAIDGIAQDGAGFAGFAAWLDMTPADPDIVAIPDVASLVQLPWRREVGWLPADLYWIGGGAIAQSPRLTLKRVLAQAKALGYSVKTGVECEYFLLNPAGDSLSDGFDRAPKPCYDQQALMRRYDVVSQICDGMLALGWQPYQTDHEDANGQFEMNWLFDDALVTADRHAFFKYMVKSIAEQHGFRATFMPKPFPELTGNGCHTHLSVWDSLGLVNHFEDAQGALGLSTLAYQFIAGVLHSAPAICALSNPTVNSYKRLNASITTSGATWSPSTISYGGNNRTHTIRIPGPGRFEFRLPDGAANPYLMPAALIVAGLEGVANQRDPGGRSDVNAYTTAVANAPVANAPVANATSTNVPTLPSNLLDALRCLESSSVLREGMGEETIQAYLKLKHQEWLQYQSQLSPWEIQNTLDC